MAIKDIIIGNTAVLTLIISAIIIVFFFSMYKYIVKKWSFTHRRKQAKKLRYLQVKLPQSVNTGSEQAQESVQNMQQNIQLMNQFYRNLHAIYKDSKLYDFLGNNYISAEILGEKEMIKFVLGVPRSFVSNIEKSISSFYPGAVINRINQPKLLEAGKYMYGGTFDLKKGNEFPIKTYEAFEADPMDSLLSAYSKINTNEKLCLQLLISPINDKYTKQIRKSIDNIKKGVNDSLFSKIIGFIGKIFNKSDDDKQDNEEINLDYSQQQLGDMDKKTEDDLFEVQIKAFATSPDKQRPKLIVQDLVNSFSQYHYQGLNSFKFTPATNTREFAKIFVQRFFFDDVNIWKFNNDNKRLFSIKELSSILHFPHSRFNKNHRISWQKYKIVPAPDDIPQEGMLIGYNNYAGSRKEIRLKPLDRFRHVYIIGQTGTGKTTLMVLQAIKDAEEGRGFCYIDPHGDACEDILAHFPKERIDDLIYFDLSNTEYPIGFNPLQAENDDERDIITNDLVEMFVNMYGPEIFGPRIQDYFRNACFLLMEQEEGGTLIDIMRLFTDDAFAESKIRNVKNPVIASRWNKTYKKMGEREKAEAIPFMQAKFGPFTTGVYIRNIIGQPKPSFSIFDAMQEKKVILCNLSKGLAGEVNSQLIGRMLTMQIKIAALKRASISIEDRVPFYLYIDEFQNYVSKSIESVLSEARKYRLGLTIAHQYIEQLKQSGLSGSIDLSTAIFGNVGTMFALKVGAPDAEFLEKEFSPEFSQSDLINMDKFKGIMKMSIDSQQSRPFSFEPIFFGDFPVKNTKEKIAVMKQISALKRGTPRDLVDKEIYYRVGV